jgi:hypothetical protein
MPGPEVDVSARPVPGGANHHADGRQLVLRLEDAVVGLSVVGVFAVAGAELLERVHHRRRRRDRVPGGHRRARVEAAQRGGRVAVDQDAVVGRVHLLEPDGQRALEVLFRVVVTGSECAVVRIAEGFFLGELLVEQLVDDVHIDVEQRDQRPEVGDVLHQDSLARLFERHAQEGDVGARERRVQRPARIVQEVAARTDLLDVADVGLRVHRDAEVVIQRPRHVTGLVDANLVPGREPLDVGRKQVLAGDRDPHPEDRLHQQTVRARGTGAVDVGELQREVVGANFDRRTLGLSRSARALSRARVASPTGFFQRLDW